MKSHHLHRNKVSVAQKIVLVIFGLFLCMILIEAGLRVGGATFLTLQLYRNRISMGEKGSYRILCLGESTTVQGGHNSYPDKLEQILDNYNTGINFSVINKGRSGIGTSYILEHLQGNLDKYRPDMLITMMGVNDHGLHLPYINTSSTGKFASLFRSLRLYKLTRLLWLHITTKFGKTLLHNEIEGKDFIKLKPKGSKRHHVNLADSVRQFKDSLRQNVDLTSRDGQAYMYLQIGWFYKTEKEYAEAEKAFQKAAKINPKDNRIYSELGLSYQEWGKYDKAEKAFRKAIETNPNDQEAYMELARFYQAEEKHSQAEEILNQAAKQNPLAYIDLGWHYKDRGRYAQTEEVLNKAMELNPRNSRVYGAAAVLYQEMKKYDIADEYYKKANELRLRHYDSMTSENYRKLRDRLYEKGVRLTCVQYPMRSIESLRSLFKGQEDDIVFVDNEAIFKDAIKKGGYKEYFRDTFAGDFGHCTDKGNQLLAENIAAVILKECFNYGKTRQ